MTTRDYIFAMLLIGLGLMVITLGIRLDVCRQDLDACIRCQTHCHDDCCDQCEQLNARIQRLETKAGATPD